MCKGLSYLPSSCLEKANKMRVKLGHLAETHQNENVGLTDPHVHGEADSVFLLRAQDGKAVQDLESLLTSKSGLQAFQAFLRSEYSEENLKFWLACEDYKDAPSKTKASSICSQFINPDAPQEVNLDAETREALLSVMGSLGADTFNTAQQRIYNLMAKDSFPRFLRSAQSAHILK
uniref:Si:ch211-196h16.12 n=1 Tax=Tetraodon nigroviridis TaxID=99883 RepID=H3C5F3_TETNG